MSVLKASFAEQSYPMTTEYVNYAYLFGLVVLLLIFSSFSSKNNNYKNEKELRKKMM